MKQLDFTTVNEDGFIEGLYVKKYDDGEALVKIFFTGWSARHDEPMRDEVEVWLSREQAQQLAEVLEEDE